ncbi:MAG: CBS domain-containing protein [Acidobacteria bacterium]|nr:CBS domain-containing protein [Acidobacteriota bacterium]
MIRWGFRLGHVRGAPIRVHWTFVVFFAVLIWATAAKHGAAAIEDLELFAGVVLSIILHEIGHAVTAQWRGLGVREICLYPFGGVTVYAGPVPPGIDEILVALAGPLTNGMLAILLLLAHGLNAPLPAAPGAPGFSLFASLFWANAFFTLFNLIPVLPLDGGWILRSLLTPPMGHLRASQFVGNLGQAFGLVLLVAGALINIWLGLAGLIVFLGAASEVQRIQPLLMLERQTAGDLMNPNVIEIAPATSFGELRTLVSMSPSPDVIVTSGDQVLGFIPAGKILALAETNVHDETPAITFTTPLAAAIPAGTPLPDALETLRRTGKSHAPIMDKHGHLEGIVSLNALERAHALFEALREKRFS